MSLMRSLQILDTMNTTTKKKKKKKDLEWETKVKVESKIFNLRNWNHRVAIN